MEYRLVEVAVPTPLLSTFDYILPNDLPDAQRIAPGARVQVPFGRRQVVGIVIAVKATSDYPLSRLKAVQKVIDDQPLLPEQVLQLLNWASDYYHYPVGEVLANALPKWLREGRHLDALEVEHYALTDSGQAALAVGNQRAPKQMQLLRCLAQAERPMSFDALREQGGDRAALKRLLEKQWLVVVKPEPIPAMKAGDLLQQTPLSLNEEQRISVDAINAAQGFSPFLLQGVTGSGKTEVYLQAIEHKLRQGRQALVLVPEIGLTPQTIARFRARFTVDIACLHSALTDSERMQAWCRARSGEARIVIGTRSALFVPMPDLGLVIIDEEHDSSFRQHSGFRYIARDMAMMRAKLLDIPIVLGSATPSLETLANVERGRYQRLRLDHRVAGGQLPSWHLVDLRDQSLQAGLSPQLLARMQMHLAQGGQVLLFLNRRGYAPVWMCHHCGYSQQCRHCDAHMTLHTRPSRLICHHCGAGSAVQKICGSCQQSDMQAVGLGTEQLEQVIAEHFPDHPVVRLDRDTTQAKGRLPQLLEQARSGEAHILIGTQMLAKGHHFPALSLVGIINADHGLMSADFRALEQMGQLCCQVAGRAGREQLNGEVLIQTHQPDHESLRCLVEKGYEPFAQHLLQQRQQAGLPPYSFLAKWVINAPQQAAAMQFAEKMVHAMQPLLARYRINCFGPMPALMERVADRYYVEAVCLSVQRRQLQQFLSDSHQAVKALKAPRHLRWSLVVDG